MPRYWKRNGRRELRIIVRNDCYRIDDRDTIGCYCSGRSKRF
jgi:hypothetical protein